MKWRLGAIGLIFLVAVGLIFGRFRNAMIGEITVNDHPILRTLNAVGAISSNDEAFRGITEVCIVNNTDISRSGRRNCKTSGEVLALIRDTSCNLIALEKLRARVLLSENTYECRKTSDPFRIVFHKQFDSTEILDFE
jgi:hypothetical protein